MRRLVAAFLLVAAISACSSGGDKQSTAPPNSFADATCVDLASWAAAVQPAFNDLRAVDSLDVSDKTAAQAKVDALGRELDAAIRATQKLADGIDSRPAPDIASGAAVKTTVVGTLREFVTAAEPVQGEIDSFDFATATAEQSTKLRSDLSALTGTLAGSLTSLAPLLTENSELRNALQNSATCHEAGSQLTGSG